MDEHIFSGYQCLAVKGSSRLELSGGVTSYWDEGRAVSSSTLFDIGSVTKVVVTASLLARAVEDKALSLDEPLGGHFPELLKTPLERITVGALASHSAGLVAWHPIFRETDRAGLLAWFAKRAPILAVSPPGEKAVYSDPGYILLGLLLEKLFGAPLAELLDRNVAQPVGMKSVLYGPIPDPAAVAATEYCMTRKRLLHGEVFDENCSFLGGRLGHAGLFASALGLLPWASEWLKAVSGESKWLGGETARLFTTPSNKAPGSTWAFGWDTKSSGPSTAGDHFSMKSFGHLGYPGCSVWVDPDVGGIAILLTNRVHPSRFDERIRGLRPRLHDAIHRHWMN